MIGICVEEAQKGFQDFALGFLIYAGVGPDD